MVFSFYPFFLSAKLQQMNRNQVAFSGIIPIFDNHFPSLFSDEDLMFAKDKKNESGEKAVIPQDMALDIIKNSIY